MYTWRLGQVIGQRRCHRCLFAWSLVLGLCLPSACAVLSYDPQQDRPGLAQTQDFLTFIPSTCNYCLSSLWSASLKCSCTVKSPSHQEGPQCSYQAGEGRGKAGVLGKEWPWAESSWSGPRNCPRMGRSQSSHLLLLPRVGGGGWGCVYWKQLGDPAMHCQLPLLRSSTHTRPAHSGLCPSCWSSRPD